MRMDDKEFYSFRRRSQKTQKQLSQLLGTSPKGIQSFEQGWGKVPGYIEPQLLFLMRMKKGMAKDLWPCWDIRGCPFGMREACPAWEFHCGHVCWFVNGTLCREKLQDTWSKKIKICGRCEVFTSTTSP